MSGQRLIDVNKAMDINTLYDWYITSVMPDDEPAWTDKHIEELFNDFYVIPKEISTIEAEPVRHGKWEEIKNAYGELEGWLCKCGREVKSKENYCPNCGARMDGE